VARRRRPHQQRGPDGRTRPLGGLHGRGLHGARVDGGAVKNNFLCQLQSDIIQTDIARPEVDETTALGSAYAAGLAVGYWDTVDELRDNWQIDREFSPEKDAEEVDKLYNRWDDAVERSLDWAQEE